MTSNNTKLPYVLVLLIIILLVIIFGLNKRLVGNNAVNKDAQVVLSDFTPTPLPETTVTPSAKKKIVTTTTIATNRPTQTNNTNTTNNSNTNEVSNATATSQPTAVPTATPVVSTPTPTQQPETVNIQAWIKGWWYSESGNQYSADGDIKIYNGNTLVASGFYNSYEEPYKVSNLPENSTLSIYFYMGTCGQLKYITTGNLSSLQQVDFHFYPSTNCLQ
jgi:hypothetical protein